MFRAFLVPALLVSLSVPALARDGDLDLSSASHITSVPVKTSLPVLIDGCFSDGRASHGLTLVHHALNVTNTGSRPITALRFTFTFYDAFNEVTSVHTNIANVQLAPGATANAINLSEWSQDSPPTRITCAVNAIRYDDGTIAKASRS